VLPSVPILSGCADIEGDVDVTNINSGDSASGLSFKYLVEVFKPVLFFVSPAALDVTISNIATITGQNLGGVTNVTFGGRPAAITSVTSGSITVIVPDNGAAPPACPAGVAVGTPTDTGTVDVTVTNATTGCTASLAQAFTYRRNCVAGGATTPTPVVATLTPTP
jgi:hypothetical protein